MKTPVQKLAFLALAVSGSLDAPDPEKLADLRFAIRIANDGNQHPLMPEERLLIATCIYSTERPFDRDGRELLGQAVQIAARHWAKKAEPGTPAASPHYWWQDL